jgi:hypothetical protein
MKIKNAKQNVAVMLRGADDLPRHALDKLNFNGNQKVEPISDKKGTVFGVAPQRAEGTAARKRYSFLSAFPMFVPSLSW